MSAAFCSSAPTVWRQRSGFVQRKWAPCITRHIAPCSVAPSRAASPRMRQRSTDTPVPNATDSQHRSRPPLSSFGFDGEALRVAVDGEWFGYEATFDAEGALLSIPDRYVPDEFRTWGVAPNGFDTVSSSQVSERALFLKRTRALPSVGCEADAVTPEVSVTKWEGPGNGAFSDGCLSCGSLQLDGSPLLTVLAFGKERVQLSFRATEGLGHVTVFRESWGSDFCNGQVLPGCGGGTRFAEGRKMDVADLFGCWEYDAEHVDLSGEMKQTRGVLNRKGTEGELLNLPAGLSVRLLRDGSSMLVESGWLHDEKRVVVQRQYEDGTLIKIKKSVERRTGG